MVFTISSPLSSISPVAPSSMVAMKAIVFLLSYTNRQGEERSEEGVLF
uniref:Uncharacterized protein n=1 Tax=Nelumbo nucifera TaxID=4432 RepID=A0A822Y4D8_NELNU|nr:TPA_asm: hypothetical protein HUJ06_027373 [Nelumbo nucifera]